MRRRALRRRWVLVTVMLAVLAVALPLGLADRIERVLEGNPTVSFPEDPAGR